MIQTAIVVNIDPKSELAQALRDAATRGKPLTIVTAEAQYTVDVSLRPESPAASESADDAGDDKDSLDDVDDDPLLNIFGVFSSGEPNDVALDKYPHLADAHLADRE